MSLMDFVMKSRTDMNPEFQIANPDWIALK